MARLASSSSTSSPLALVVLLCTLLLSFVLASPTPTSPTTELAPLALTPRTTEPYFPDYPPSCTICAANYANISSCAEAAPIFANFSQILWNPSAFIAVIECSCTDTFKSAFPQCVDCFQMTNQTDVLQSDDLPAVVSGMRTVCALASTLLGGVASTNQQLPSQTPITVYSNGTVAGGASILDPHSSMVLLSVALASLVGTLVGIGSLL